MNSCNSSIDSALPRNDSCESHVSVYYEQDQKKELRSGPPINPCNSLEKVYENPPVEINDEETTSIDLPPLAWHGYENCPKFLTVTNTGRTILINGHWTNIRPYIEGGPLNGTYLLSQIHFHCPSEHEINGKRYPLEMHIVHYKTSYLTQEKAMQEKDGTVVLVYLFQLTDTCDTAVSQITKLGCELKEVNSRTETTEILLNKLITPFFSNYYVYWGSLTTRKNKYLLQWIINCNLLGVTQQEVEDLSNIITSAIGLTVKQSPRLKPEFDDIYHVGEADYSLPPLKTSSAAELCTVCKHSEIVPYVSCSCKLEKVKCDGETDDNGTPNVQLVCKCKSKTQVREHSCRRHGDKYICSKYRSYEMSPCTRCTSCERREGILLGTIFSRQMKPRTREKLYCDIEDGSDGEVVLRCKNKSLLMNCYKTLKKKQKKIKKKTRPKRKKSSSSGSKKSSSKSSVSVSKSKDKLDSGAQSGDSEEKSSKKDLRFKEEIKISGSIKEDHKVKKKNKKKKKKKNEVAVHDSMISLKRDQSKPSLKTITVLPQMEQSSSCMILLSPKSSAHVGMKEMKESHSSKSSVNATDGEEEENKKLDSGKCSANDVLEREEEKKTDNAEVKITQTCAIIEEPLSTALAKESKSSIDKEKKEENSLKNSILKSAVNSRSAKSRSKSRVNVEKTKDSESPEKKNLASRKSKSKSSVSEVPPKNKASMKKESECNECPDSKAVKSDTSKSKMEKSKTVSEPTKSAQEVKCQVKKSIPAIENLKSDSAPQKDTKTKSARLRKKSTEEAKGKNKTDNEGQDGKQDYDITTLFEKKQDGKKAQTLAGDSNDVKVNYLLSPGTNIKSDPSCALATSESDFTEEKKACASIKKSHFSQDFTVNTATIAGSEFPSNEIKEHLQGCILMEHTLRTDHKGTADEYSSQEYHVAIMYDQCIVQEYTGNFHPQELLLGDCVQVKLVPKYPEPENFNFRLQDCFIKKQSLDQICVRVKFLLKDLNVLNVPENNLNATSEKKDKLLFDQQTQCNLKDLGSLTSSISKSIMQNKSNEKILDSRSNEILINQYKLENEEKQKQETKNEEEQKRQSKNEEEQKEQLKGQEEQKLKENEITEPQKYTNKLQNDSDVHSQDTFPSSVTEQFSTDSNLKENKMETERGEKKLKSLFVKRRKTVYFIYDKVEKDESTGKKVFVGSFKTKEELDGLKKPKVLFQENEAVSANGKSEETCQAKGFPPFENKEANLKVTKGEASSAWKSSSSAKNSPSVSQDTSNRNKDLVTLHRYKPKYPETNRCKRDCRNMFPVKVIDNSQRNNESYKNLANALKEKTPKTDMHELRKASESEPQKENTDPYDGKTEKKVKPKNVVPNKNQENYSQTEVTVHGKSSKAKEDSVRDNSQRSVDKKESQAALILIPVEVESLLKTEVILIEQLDKSKKDKKKDKNIP